MKLEIIASEHLSRAGVVAVALVLGMAAGCRNSQPVRTDQQIATDVQAKIQTESALNGQNIQVTVANGVATLSGSVTDEASRALAGNDSGSISGVKSGEQSNGSASAAVGGFGRATRSGAVPGGPSTPRRA